MTAKKPKIAIVGATGNVGREVLDIIDDRESCFYEEFKKQTNE